MNNHARNSSFAVIGAGPYGLAVASHLREAGVDVRIFGKVMDFWHNQMPIGMKLRSPLAGSNISDPQRQLSLERFAAAQGRQLAKALPLEHFVEYGQWFQREALPDVDPRNVVGIERRDDGFSVNLEDGERIGFGAVVVATGIGSFPNRPAPFASLPAELVSHTSDRINRDLGRFAGRRVIVVGSGQSALESAALLNESGAEVEVLARRPSIRYLNSNLEWLMDHKLYPFKAPGKIGPIGLNWLIEHPHLFTLFPRRWQARMTARAIRSAGSGWLRPRVQSVAFKTGKHAIAASVCGARVLLKLNDGADCEADHVLLGTGYHVDIARYRFLSPDLLRAVRTANGYPILNRGFESSLPGLYFVGTTATYSFGPLCRFVAGTPFVAETLTNYVRKLPRPNPVRGLEVQAARS
jgi:hypothetical protein